MKTTLNDFDQIKSFIWHIHILFA